MSLTLRQIEGRTPEGAHAVVVALAQRARALTEELVAAGAPTRVSEALAAALTLSEQGGIQQAALASVGWGFSGQTLYRVERPSLDRETPVPPANTAQARALPHEPGQ